jgi:glycosyltransferase involved in cell wall biosynthesis
LSRPRLLFLSQTLPFPPDGGVKIRTYNVVKQLATAFDIVALCFYRAKAAGFNQQVDAALVGLGEFARVEAFPIPQEHSRPRLLRDHVQSLLGARVYTAFAYRSPRFRARLVQLLHEERFDLAHADSLDLSDYFPLIEGVPVVCVHHDAQSVLLRRRADRYRTPWNRWYLSHQAELMRREESWWCPRVALNVAVSETDQDALKTVAPAGRFTVVPNGVDLEYFRPGDDGGAAKLVFVGGSTWFPNLDAMRYLGDAILPLIREAGGSPHVLWVGRATASERQEFRRAYGIETTGYVDDVRPQVQQASCYVVPIRVGGGTRIKILDAWAMGKAVVSTSIGCEGLAAVDGDNILIRDDPRGFADAVARVLEDAPLRQALGRAGRSTVERLYSWERIGRRMVSDYMALVDSRSSGASRTSSPALRS